METCMITFRSVTPAQRGESLLRREGIACTLQRTPKNLADQGCGYSLRLRCDRLTEATELMRRKGIAFRKAYRITEAGIPGEILL